MTADHMSETEHDYTEADLHERHPDRHARRGDADSTEEILAVLNYHRLDIWTGQCVNPQGFVGQCQWRAKKVSPKNGGRSAQHRRHLANLLGERK